MCVQIAVGEVFCVEGDEDSRSTAGRAAGGITVAVEEPSMAAAAARRRGGGRGDGGEKALGTALTKDVYELGA